MIGFGQESFRSGSCFSSRSACGRRKMGLERLVSRISNAAIKVFFLRLRRVSLGCKTLLAIGCRQNGIKLSDHLGNPDYPNQMPERRSGRFRTP